MDDKNSSTSGATEAAAPSARAHHAGDGGAVAPWRVVNIGNSEKVQFLNFVDAIEAELGIPRGVT